MSDDDFRAKMLDGVKEFSEDTPFDEALWNDFAQGMFYYAGDLNDPKCYTELAEARRDRRSAARTDDNVLFYLSTQPSYYEVAISGIGEAKLNNGRGLAAHRRREALRPRPRERPAP